MEHTRESPSDQTRFTVRVAQPIPAQCITGSRSKTQVQAISSSVGRIPSLPLKFYVIIHVDWDSWEAHSAIVDKPAYLDLLKALTPSLSGTHCPEMYHIQFSGPTVALEKPVTEVLVLTLKAPENRATMVDILSEIAGSSGESLIFGQTREEENKYILIGGWETVEVGRSNATRVLPLDDKKLTRSSQAHWEAVAKPEAAAAFERLYSLANKDHLFHTNLLQYRL